MATAEQAIPAAAGGEAAAELRIGVFVCHCGKNIAGFVDTARVRQYAAGLPGVVHASEDHYTCSQPGIQAIQEGIRRQGLTRVVVAACTPRTHEPLFRKAVREAGLNPFLFEFVNIREQCSWIHARQPEEATRKAMDLVRMGVTKAALLAPGEEVEVPVRASAVVLGGGIAGMTAALSLARRGFEVQLVEREERLGGLLNRLHRLFPTGEEAGVVAARAAAEVEAQEKIEVLTGTRLREVRGYIGNFVLVVERGGETREIPAGAIILATGARVLRPEGLYGYDGRRVITQLELEERTRRGEWPTGPVVMIQCAGSRTPERPACMKVCCMVALKNALEIRRCRPDVQVTLLYREIQAAGAGYEEAYREARRLGVRFVRYSPQRPPAVAAGGVTVYDELMRRELELEAELVVLSTPLLPQEDTVEVSKQLRVPVSEDGFFLEAHAQLAPVDFATDGVYLCGCAHWPADVAESVARAQGAAARASIPLTRGKILVEPIFCQVVRPDLCRGCGICEDICDYHAPGLVERGDGTLVAAINEVVCKGCGTCAAMCPTGAIDARQFTDRQLLSMMETALRG